ncbi:hypothetical protein [Streptomyces piniterrae]|uniref:hypothetical protein n=1 Tax=Streptomyces piniterrae TaxID=2571125 RepID=UPI001C9E89E1|nr:hypothetical protein [Streptomyces piniterrae]
MYTVLPVWRQHRLARTDWPLGEQAYALQALMAGFLQTANRNLRLLRQRRELVLASTATDQQTHPK